MLPREYQYQFDAAGNRTQMTYFNGTSDETTTERMGVSLYFGN